EYDRLGGRWVITAVNTASVNNRVLVAVSDGPHVTSQSDFTFFSFHHNSVIPSHAGQFADYPQLGVDANAVYVGVNDFLGRAVPNSSVFVIKESTLYAASPTLDVTGFEVASGLGQGPSSPQPATDMDPSMASGYIVGPDNALFSRIDVLRISDPGGTP